MNDMEVLTVNGQSFAIADGEARKRLDNVEAGYRHIATVTNDTGAGITNFEVKKDQAGNDFACKDFLIFATFPKLESGLSTQLYIGPPAWKWIVFMPTAMSVSFKRTWRLHLHHLVGGKWGMEGYYTDGELPYQSTAGVAVTVTSVEAPGETLNQLLFWSNTTSHFPNGTTFEIYGR